MRDVVQAGPTRLGLLLECIGIAIAFAGRGLHPRTEPLFLLGAAVSSIIGIALAWTSVTHLGKQFRVHAGLYADHELVRTGPYAIVRHPIYAALLAMLLCTIFLLTPWQWALVAVAIYIVGTEIRVRLPVRLVGQELEAFDPYQLELGSVS